MLNMMPIIRKSSLTFLYYLTMRIAWHHQLREVIETQQAKSSGYIWPVLVGAAYVEHDTQYKKITQSSRMQTLVIVLLTHTRASCINSALVKPF